MRKTHKQKMSLFTRVITEVLGEWVTIIGQHSGHYLLMKVHSKHTEREVKYLSQESHIGLQDKLINGLKNITNSSILELQKQI